MGKERTYLTDTSAENLSGKMIGSANFSLYVFDKNKARIGEGYINLSNVSVGQTVKVSDHSSGVGGPSVVGCVYIHTAHRIHNSKLSSTGRVAEGGRQGRGHYTKNCRG
jgi:hypothetical protein